MWCQEKIAHEIAKGFIDGGISMIIGCTKKLLDEMGITAESSHEEKELFCWSAHLVTVNRRKAVVVVNDSNRFGFVLYGLKAKEFKKINELIVQGIRRCLQNEKIKEEIIDGYLREAGAVSFSKTKGPKYVSRLNKACELVGFFEDLLDLSDIYQNKVTDIINNDLIKVDKKSDYEHPCDLLLKDFKEAHGDSIVKCEAALLLVKLNLGAYTAERRIITPIDIDFKGLHEILQVAFDWKEYHLHKFNVINEKGKCVINLIGEHEEIFEVRQDCMVAQESEVLIKDYMKDGFKLLYYYDFGDNWQHEITVKDIIPDYDKNFPICLEGMGDAPPENVGGIPGYEEFLEIMGDPKHSRYKEIMGWAESQWYRKFDIELVNKRLRYTLRR